MHVFMSYARDDLEQVKPLVKALSRRGLSVWWDPKILPGQEFHEVIERALESAFVVIAVWSRSSVRSRWVIGEATVGLERDILVPLIIDNVKPPIQFRSLQTPDLSTWDGNPESSVLEPILSRIRSLVAQVCSETDGDDASSSPSPEPVTIQGHELVLVPGGTFLMGSSSEELQAWTRDLPENIRKWVSLEQPSHPVKLEPFYLGRYPVTNRDYSSFRAQNPSVRRPRYEGRAGFDDPNQPVVGISWREAGAYCEWAGLALPTEAQWEFACRAGTRSSFHGGEHEEDLARSGWYAGNSEGAPHAVGEKSPNAFGLYDMHGNVWEWCRDDLLSYRVLPQGAEGERQESAAVPRSRAARGGSFASRALFARSSSRNKWNLRTRHRALGFRPAVTVERANSLRGDDAQAPLQEA